MGRSLAHLLFTNFLLSTPKTRGSTSGHWRPKEASWRRPRGDPEAAEGATRRRLRATWRRLRARESDAETVDRGWGRLIRSGLITQCTAVLRVIGNENTHGWETTFSMADATCGACVNMDGQAYLQGGGVENGTKLGATLRPRSQVGGRDNGGMKKQRDTLWPQDKSGARITDRGGLTSERTHEQGSGSGVDKGGRQAMEREAAAARQDNQAWEDGETAGVGDLEASPMASWRRSEGPKEGRALSTAVEGEPGIATSSLKRVVGTAVGGGSRRGSGMGGRKEVLAVPLMHH
ncbi:hypothetical protein B0H14DRAFT_2631962 [Mycena olivaceomarginata]|nr:hypothetical protein B0H14DRAFT_2631962 [Mycena olivaceomarginata]